MPPWQTCRLVCGAGAGQYTEATFDSLTVQGDRSLETPSTQYADANGVQIAYQIWGDGAVDLIVVPGIVSHIEAMLDFVEYEAWLRRAARRFRVVVFDKRGQGLSERIDGVPSPEEKMDDIAAVMTAIGSKRAALFGQSEGAAISVLFAATYPERVRGIVLWGGFARFSNTDDYDLMFDDDVMLRSVKHWGTGASLLSFCQHHVDAPGFREKFAKLERLTCSPNEYRRMLETNMRIDVRPILSQVRVPALVMHRRDDKAIPVNNGRYLADNLPGAKYVEFAEGGHLQTLGDTELPMREIEEFLFGAQPVEPSTRTALSTVLFTDIVESSRRLGELGDSKWAEVLDRHDQVAGEIIAEYRGELIKHTGDGVLAAFDGPARGVRCALALVRAMADMSLEIRCGLHIGEVEWRRTDIAGMAVHIAARVIDVAAPGEVLATRTICDLVAGSGLVFDERGEHVLKGIAGDWALYAASPDS